MKIILRIIVTWWLITDACCDFFREAPKYRKTPYMTWKEFWDLSK